MISEEVSIPIDDVQQIVRKFSRGALCADQFVDGLIAVAQAGPRPHETAVISDAKSLITTVESSRDLLPSLLPPAAVVVALFLGLRLRSPLAIAWCTDIQNYLESVSATERSTALNTLYSRTFSGLDDRYLQRVLPLVAESCSPASVDAMRYQLGLWAARSGDFATALPHIRRSSDGRALIDALLQEVAPGTPEWLTAVDELFAHAGNRSEVAAFAAADAAAVDRPDLAAHITERLAVPARTASTSAATCLALTHHFLGNHYPAMEFGLAARHGDAVIPGRLAEPISSWVLASRESNPDAALALLQASSYWIVHLGALRARIELDIALLLAGEAPLIAALFLGRVRRHMHWRSADYSRSETVRYGRMTPLLNRFAVSETEVTTAEDALARRGLRPLAESDLHHLSRFDEAWHFRPERRYDQSLITLRN